ncbi:MAG: hypothetical protein JW699_02855 [Chitinispirillaceae bacterium]|nr:hypothetical protein [Chitinispirillaceae bacterium]
MAELMTRLLFDCSMMSSMLILAYLSRKMGEALKIFPYYLVLYAAAGMVVAAGSIDIAVKAQAGGVSPELPVLLRCSAGAAAFAAGLRYWKWLFGEFFGR